MKDDPFESYELLDYSRPVLTEYCCLLSKTGYVFGIFGAAPGAYHSGYESLGKELLLQLAAGSIKRGVSFSSAFAAGLVFHNAWSSGYYHWLVEAMPRLIKLKERWGNVPLVIPQSLPNPWFRDWLYSISEGKYYDFRRGSMLIRKCTFQENPKKMSEYSRPDVNAVADYFFNFFSIDQSSEGCDLKVYITRRNAGHRKVANESDVTIFLERQGFLIASLDDMSFPEQVKLFSNSSLVVSIHGAGLSNILFMKEGARVVELIQRPHPERTWGSRRETFLLNPCFKALAEVRAVEHNYLLCDYDEKTTPELVIDRYGTLHGNLYVDISRLSDIINAV